jgi:HEXXH motif-containing protein
LITTHSLSADALTALAGGAGDGAVVRQLREAQLSKHLMLLHVVASAANEVDPPSRETAAFRAGYRLLAEAQAADPAAVAGLLGLPHIGSWAHDCLARLESQSLPDYGYLADVAVAAAVRLGIGFEMSVPVRDGCVQLPGLGSLQIADQGEWVKLSCDGERLRVGGVGDVACAALVPDDGSGKDVPLWRGTPQVRCVADGQTWEVLLETADRHLDRYRLPVLAVMTTAEFTSWRHRIQAAWDLLVRHHQWAAAPIAECVPVIVPLAPRSDHNSATSPAAFGAIAASLPPSSVTLAETLVHEFQHIKLGGLIDMLPLSEPTAERGYAPWREDPRPMSGILQGLYAFSGVVRFWDAQRRVETEPDEILRASVLYERWRLAVDLAAGSLRDKRILTPAGDRFVAALRERACSHERGPTPEEAAAIAREVALDHWLTWQLRHTALDGAGVKRLAAAYQRGEAARDQELPETCIQDDVRKFDSVTRSRLLNMRYGDPQQYRQLAATNVSGLGGADAIFVRGDADTAVAAYREALAAEPDPAAWIGLALAMRRSPETALRPVFARHLPLLFEMHAYLSSEGVHVKPLDLAGWFQ